jgi:hypothetical protein
VDRQQHQHERDHCHDGHDRGRRQRAETLVVEMGAGGSATGAAALIDRPGAGGAYEVLTRHRDRLPSSLAEFGSNRSTLL